MHMEYNSMVIMFYFLTKSNGKKDKGYNKKNRKIKLQEKVMKSTAIEYTQVFAICAGVKYVSCLACKVTDKIFGEKLT